MTLVYVPTLIESVEQAEKLPEGTVVAGVARRTGRFEVAFRDADGTYWGSTCSIEDDEDTIGMQALVPVEAEEEARSVARHPGGGQTNYNTEAASNPGRMGEYIASLPVERRLITPWEPAP